MPVPTHRRLPRIKRGDIITATPFLNGIVDQVNENTQRLGAPRQVTQGTPPGAASEGAVQRMQVIAEANDTVLCFDTTGNAVDVAKPFRFRGDTGQRLSNGEAQELVEPYVVGQFILAIKDILGGTNAIGSNGQFAEWMDINVDGRMWAES